MRKTDSKNSSNLFLISLKGLQLNVIRYRMQILWFFVWVYFCFIEWILLIRIQKKTNSLMNVFTIFLRNSFFHFFLYPVCHEVYKYEKYSLFIERFLLKKHKVTNIYCSEIVSSSQRIWQCLFCQTHGDSLFFSSNLHLSWCASFGCLSLNNAIMVNWRWSTTWFNE